MSDKTEATETEEPSTEDQNAEPTESAENGSSEASSPDNMGEAEQQADSGDEAGPEEDGTETPPASPEERIAELEAEGSSLNDRLLRAMAETENIRRRSQRDKQDTARYAITNFARDMLSVADNLGRALGSVDEEARKDNGVIENLMIGVEMTERELMAAMERVGVTRMEPIGTRFDPNVHEAMFEYDDPSQPAGTVGQVIEPGYMIHERPLRPAKVGITKGGPKAAPVENTDEASASDSQSDSTGSTAYESSGDAPGGQIDEEL